MHTAMLIIHLLGLVMGLGTGIGFMFLGIAQSKMEPEEGKAFQLKSLALGSMGRIGMVLSIISGGYLATPYWSTIGENPLFIAKLVLVLVMIAMIALIEINAKKAKQTNGAEGLDKLKTFGMITMPAGLGILILAVLAFN